MIKSFLESIVDRTWTNNIKEVEYKEYWLLQPHCLEAKAFRVVDGSIIYRCKHYE
jgi:hypothetical protein